MPQIRALRRLEVGPIDLALESGNFMSIAGGSGMPAPQWRRNDDPMRPAP